MRTVERLESGRFKVRFRLAKRQTSETFATKRDAERFAGWLDALGPHGALDKLYEGEQAASVPTLDQVAADHFEHIDGAGEGHKIKSRRLWERTWGPRIGGVRADHVTRDMLIAAMSDLATNGLSRGRGYAAKSLYNQRGLLHGVLERCVDQGYLSKHPGLKLRIPQTTVALDDDDEPSAEMVCLTPEGYELLRRAMSPHYQPLVRFLAGTGVRWGEAVALRISDLNLDEPTLRIRRALKWSPDGNHRIGPPKTSRSRRTVWLPAEVVGDLRELARGRRGTDLVFTAPRGGMIRHRTFWSDHWRPAIWRAQHCPKHTLEDCRCGTAHPKRCPLHQGDSPPCYCPGTLAVTPRIHDLRHSHASWMLGQGVPIHVVSARLGHQSIQTTVDTYGHLLPDAQMMAANAASLVFAQRPALT